MKIKANKLVESLDRQNDIGEDRTGFYRLDKNERVIPFKREFLNKIIKSIKDEDLSAYANQSPLYDLLSKKIEINKKNILLTPGSDAAIKYIFETFVSQKDLVGFLHPTYAMIEVYAKLYGAKIFKVEYNQNLKINYEQLDILIKQKPKVVFLANPNQPTGTVIPDNKLDKIIKKFEASNTIVVLDQAYIEFSNIKMRYRYAVKNKNLILTNTFSKAYGLAGVRMGYIVSNLQIINLLYRVKPLSDINIFAIKAAEQALKNSKILDSYIRSVNHSKKLVKKFCKENNIDFINSHTNFIHMRVDVDLVKLSKLMKKKKFLIRTTGKGLPATIKNCVRITLGDVMTTKKFLNAFDQSIKALRALI